MSVDEVRRVARSSGNVFADLGFAEPEMELTKAKLAHQIGRVIADRGWTQAQAAVALGIGQPKVSVLLRGNLSGFSTDRLIRFLNRLDQDVTITVEPRLARRPRAGVTVSVNGERGAASGAKPDDGSGMRF